MDSSGIGIRTSSPDAKGQNCRAGLIENDAILADPHSMTLAAGEALHVAFAAGGVARELLFDRDLRGRWQRVELLGCGWRENQGLHSDNIVETGDFGER